jgi:hypothetical protein
MTRLWYTLCDLLRDINFFPPIPTYMAGRGTVVKLA